MPRGVNLAHRVWCGENKLFHSASPLEERPDVSESSLQAARNELYNEHSSSFSGSSRKTTSSCLQATASSRTERQNEPWKPDVVSKNRTLATPRSESSQRGYCGTSPL